MGLLRPFRLASEPEVAPVVVVRGSGWSDAATSGWFTTGSTTSVCEARGTKNKSCIHDPS